MSFRVLFELKVIFTSVCYNELDEDRDLFSGEFNVYSENLMTFIIFNLFLSQVLNDSMEFYLVINPIPCFILLIK